jgi:hypothetical protein
MPMRFFLCIVTVLGATVTVLAQPSPFEKPAPPTEVQWRAAGSGTTTASPSAAATVPAATAPAATAPAAYCPPACGPEPCGYPGGRAWVSAEWLFWATSGNPVPPLVTAAPPGTAEANTGGVLPPTVVSIGGQRLNNDFRNGLRVGSGIWLDDGRTFGLEGDFLFLGQSRERFVAGSDGSQILARPFFNSSTGLPDAQLVSFPGLTAGTVAADSTSNLIGGGVNLLHNLCCDPCGRMDLLVGYRYLNLRDDLRITEDLTGLGGAGVPAGTRFLISDRFRASNDFHGAVIGANAERGFGPWFVGVRASAALGVVHEVVTVDGTTSITPPGGAAAVYPGGLLALPTNIGRFSRDRFAVVPEVRLRAGCQVTDGLRVFAGYNMLYWSDVARSGDQIDPRVNPGQIPPPVSLVGPAVPAALFRTTDFWGQGVSVGAEFRF